MGFSNRPSTWILVTILGIAAWRRISKRRSIQVKLHACCKKLTPLVQWYTMLTVAMLVFVIYSIVEYFLTYGTKRGQEKELERIYNEPGQKELLEAKLNITTVKQFKEVLAVPTWIYVVNGISQVSGALTIGIVIYQMWAQFILPCRTAAQQNPIWNTHDWLLPKRVDWILWILIVPAFFCIEAMRANTKVWGLVTGKSRELVWLRFYHAEKLELLYEHEDLEMASLIQFSAIYAFTRLISSLLEQTDVLKRGATVSVSTAVVALRPGKTINSNIDGEHKADPDAKIQRLAGEYKRLVRLGGFLGLWVYIIAGSIRALVTITIAVLLQLRAKMEIEDDKTAAFLENAEVAFEGMTSTAFLLLTALSVITMVIMSGTYIVTDKIGDANKSSLGRESCCSLLR
mmetsp:Transcript_66927/g.129453  ORF Transcript_66927/g.129453 Transcript_66927/m.129453 type:complete len:401 (+) Transcript_66927:75-1277(+)